VPITSCDHEVKIFDIETRSKLVEKAVEILRTWSDDFDAIAVSGYSSGLTAPIVAHLLGKELVLVRKETESRHSTYVVEGKHNQRVLFFDDLIASGHTIQYVRKHLPSINCRLVGWYLFQCPESWYMAIDGNAPAIKNMNSKKENHAGVSRSTI
jgi:adenine/guanine phosphoribosyltransferase-like PRPP-binding protein